MTKTTSINLQAAQRDALLKRGGNKYARQLLTEKVIAEIRKDADALSKEIAEFRNPKRVEKIINTQTAIESIVKSYSSGGPGGYAGTMIERNNLFDQLRRIAPNMTPEQFVAAVKKSMAK